MALNLLRAKRPLTVWNRTTAKAATLKEAGATVAGSVGTVFHKCPVVILMLANSTAIDAVLRRGRPDFEARVRDRTIIHMGTTSPTYSERLEREIVEMGGRYVEAPVSGSRKPAEEGKLVVMLAGDPRILAEVKPLIAPMAASAIECGVVPKATLMKLAVNTYLIGKVTALVEATNFARKGELDMKLFQEVLSAGPMASDVMRTKLAKLIDLDFSVQAAIANVLDNNRLVRTAAKDIGAAVPLIDVCEALYAEAEALGHAADDMVAVLDAVAARSSV